VLVLSNNFIDDFNLKAWTSYIWKYFQLKSRSNDYCSHL